MQLKTFKTLWGNKLTIDEACDQAKNAGFDGIEGQAPLDDSQRNLWQRALNDHDCDYIAEVVTGGDYVPQRDWSSDQHLEDLRLQLEASLPLQPMFVTSITGCDAWSLSESIDFFGRAMALAASYDIPINFETHRSRSLFTPWITLEIARQLPDMRLTADISHWCVVCERLMDSETATLEALAPQIHHIHARVGYDQGPQVPHPAAPEYADALTSHQRFWETFWHSQYSRGMKISTMTPEFGPDGYCHTQPFTGMPVVDLWEVNRWMATQERRHFMNVMQTMQGKPS